MRTGLLVPAVIGLAAAFPSDVDVDSATIEKALEVYKSTGSVPEEGVAVGNEKRTINWSAWCPLLSQWICAKLPTAYGPTISPDTVDAFHASTVLAVSLSDVVYKLSRTEVTQFYYSKVHKAPLPPAAM